MDNYTRQKGWSGWKRTPTKQSGWSVWKMTLMKQSGVCEQGYENVGSEVETVRNGGTSRRLISGLRKGFINSGLKDITPISKRVWDIVSCMRYYSVNYYDCLAQYVFKLFFVLKALIKQVVKILSSLKVLCEHRRKLNLYLMVSKCYRTKYILQQADSTALSGMRKVPSRKKKRFIIRARLFY